MRSRIAVLVCALSVGVLVAAQAATSQSARLRYRASLSAPTHNPIAGQPWRYTVRVRNLAGHGITVSSRQMVLSGQTRLDTIGWFAIRANFRHTYRWPLADRGKALTFRVRIKGPGGWKNLDYAIRVR